MDLLIKSGFNFELHRKRGIPHTLFAEYLITSTLCLNPEVHWITFHGGVDFGYLLKSLIGSNLPSDETSFFQLMDAYFCNYYDLKEIKRDISHLANGGLSKLAKDLDVERIGTVHQAGSDSFVTSKIFFKMKEIYNQWFGKKTFKADQIESRYRGKLYGLGESICEDPYIDEYRQITVEYSTHLGQPINLNTITSPI